MHLHQLLTVVGRPLYVKVAAEQPHREYQMDSREDVYLAAVTTLARGEPIAKYAAHAKFWQIQGDLDKAEANWKLAHEERPVPEDSFCLVQEYEGAPVLKYAAYDRESTGRAANAFYENRTHYPYEWRKQAAESLLVKQAQYGAILPQGVESYLKKAACLASPTQDSLEQALVERFATGSHKAGYTKLAELVHTVACNPLLRCDREVVKVAMHAMDTFDADLRTRPALAEESLRILDDEFVKVAQDELADHVTLVNGHILKVSELNRDALGAVSPELADMSHEQLRDVLPTLPLNDARLLIRLQA